MWQAWARIFCVPHPGKRADRVHYGPPPAHGGGPLSSQLGRFCTAPHCEVAASAYHRPVLHLQNALRNMSRTKLKDGVHTTSGTVASVC